MTRLQRFGCAAAAVTTHVVCGIPIAIAAALLVCTLLLGGAR